LNQVATRVVENSKLVSIAFHRILRKSDAQITKAGMLAIHVADRERGKRYPVLE